MIATTALAGSDVARDAQVDWLLAEAFSSESASSTYEDLATRCDGALSRLETGRQAAGIEFAAYRFPEARATLVAALEEARRFAPPRSITRVLAARGLVMNRAIGTGDGLVDRAAIRLLDRLIPLIRKVNRDFERPYYFRVGTLCLYGSCDPVYESRYQDQFSLLASSFLDFVLEQAEPLAFDTTELRIHAIASRWVADDLAQSLDRRQFACSIRGLLEQSRLAGTPSASPSSLVALIRSNLSVISRRLERLEYGYCR